MDLHDRIARELTEGKSLGALIYLIGAGRELEFSVGGRMYFLSRHRSARFVSLWDGDAEQSFDSVEDCLRQAVIAGEPFLRQWGGARIETLF